MYYFPSDILHFNPRGLWSLYCIVNTDSKNSNTNLFLARRSGKGSSVSQGVLGLPIFSLFSCCFLLRKVRIAQYYATLWEVKTLKRKPFIRLEELGKEGTWELENVSGKGELENGIVP